MLQYEHARTRTNCYPYKLRHLVSPDYLCGDPRQCLHLDQAVPRTTRRMQSSLGYSSWSACHRQRLEAPFISFSSTKHGIHGRSCAETVRPVPSTRFPLCLRNDRNVHLGSIIRRNILRSVLCSAVITQLSGCIETPSACHSEYHLRPLSIGTFMTAQHDRSPELIVG